MSVRAGADRVALGASAVQALGLWAGIRCGPALMSPFSAHVLMATGIPRAQVLGRAALRNMTLGTLLVGITSASLILSASRGSLEQGAAGGPTLLVVLASVVLGGQASLAWAVGQRVGPGAASGIVALILVLSGSATLWSPTILLTTGGWYGLLATGQVPTPADWMLLAAAGALTACAWVMYRALPSGLSSVPTTRIMVQAQRVESALLLAGGGDLRRAAEATRSPPRRHPPMRLGHSVQKATHRRLSAVSVGWRQDAAASLRHPGQALRSVVLLMAAGMVAGLVGPTTGYGGEDVVSGTAAMLALCLLLDAGLWWPEHEGGIGAGGWSSLESAAQGACWAVAAVVVMFSCRLLQEVTSRDAPLLGIPPVPTPVGDLTGVLLLLGSIRGVLTAAAMLGALAVLIHEPWTQVAATAVLAAVAALASLLGAPRLAESR